jgi:phosphoribosylformimino-5-aminoimidazole carboxamide ribotide isomerase
LRIVPVIDILNGVTVHAIKGRREEYQPLKSVLTDSVQPIEVANAFKTAGFSELYIADLDAIMSQGSNLDAIDEIAKDTGLQIMLDSGVSDLTSAKMLSKHDISKIIVGTESIRDLKFIENALELFGKGRIIVSIDLKAGQVLSNSKETKLMTPLKLATDLVELGISELIVLDLARVGSGEGVDVSLLKKMVSGRKAKILVGGGIRGVDDLLALNPLGVDGVLLATCLHSGKVTVDDLRRLKLL